MILLHWISIGIKGTGIKILVDKVGVALFCLTYDFITVYCVYILSLFKSSILSVEQIIILKQIGWLLNLSTIYCC